MDFSKYQQKIASLILWSLICILIGIFSGSASALLLFSLDWVTQLFTLYKTLFWLLPLGGLVIGLLYHYLGNESNKGNNLLLIAYENPETRVPLRMGFLVFLGTLITHLLGGSAGREGTAVQMGGAIAYQLNKIKKISNTESQILILLGISAGFASVFGTPLAGAIFALEIVCFKRITLKSILSVFLVAFIADYTVDLWEIKHSTYYIFEIPNITFKTLLWVLVAGLLFGLTAMLYSKTAHYWNRLFSVTFPFAPWRPLVGGSFLVILFYCFDMTRYTGLGLTVIAESFTTPSLPTDFLLKIIITGITLGSGFKGGEVTPLFFIGATLGSALSLVVPLPVSLLAGMGFVALLSGATHTPIACTLMGIELFGIEAGLFLCIACSMAYFCSGSTGIYTSQLKIGLKYTLYAFCLKKIRLLRGI
ncbi:chloride channel protein [Flavobacterium sp. SOK18b]|uniref:chloride channel protein n=1 Tax=Flavobacterium sp. SOK18b TaxID=797900 RepID=UPI0015F8D69D|nr:chloride channel protein [Flavobacterium sp. SOK18b]MBB1192219.1 chloride channel protein [Flavobacterium sp. SOK18b]